jgi:hypothetical protein
MHGAVPKLLLQECKHRDKMSEIRAFHDDKPAPKNIEKRRNNRARFALRAGRPPGMNGPASRYSLSGFLKKA